MVSVVVRAVRYPKLKANLPENWQKIAEHCARNGNPGYFLSVSVAHAKESFDPTGREPAMPLLRGHGLYARFERLRSYNLKPDASRNKLVVEHPDKGGLVMLKYGPYGPFVSHNGVNANLPKGTSPDHMTLTEAIALLDARLNKRN